MSHDAQPEVAIELHDLLQRLLKNLRAMGDDRLGDVVQLRIEGYSNQEIGVLPVSVPEIRMSCC